jgi:hypothetical protein
MNGVNEVVVSLRVILLSGLPLGKDIPPWEKDELDSVLLTGADLAEPWRTTDATSAPKPAP